MTNTMIMVSLIEYGAVIRQGSPEWLYVPENAGEIGDDGCVAALGGTRRGTCSTGVADDALRKGCFCGSEGGGGDRDRASDGVGAGVT